ncbi:MAG: hypothetical protein QOE93_909, partial [Actinomycetota bacterium]|nr:hypothetical protein [Actinomycetota bacterium]
MMRTDGRDHDSSFTSLGGPPSRRRRGGAPPAPPRRWATLVALALVGAVAPLAPWAAAPASATTNSAPQVASGTYALGAVFCQSVHSCIAVGAADTDPDPNVIDQVGALVHIVDGVPGPATLVPGTDLLIGVACATSTSCVATGSFQATGASPTIGVAVPVNPDGTPAGSPVEFPGTILLWRVACATASTCVAVGMTPDVDPDPVGSDIKGVVVTITDGDVATADVQYVPDASGLFGVDCGDATSCVAAGIVGVYGSSSTQGVIVPLTISAGTVTAHPAVLATGGPGGGTQFFGVGCSSGTDCTSVGIAVDNPAPSPSAVGLVASTDGATVGVPGTYFLFEADCAAPGSCLAVGSNALSTTSVAGVAVPVTGGTPGPVHSIWGTTFLEGVDCPTTTTCIAVGANGLDVNDSVGVVVTINPEAAATALGVDVTGTQASGSSTATFTATPSSSPAGVTVNGTVTCATVDGGQAIDATLAVGNHTIDAASCTGLSLGGPNTGNYDLVVTGSTFTVTQTQVATT